MSKSGNSTFTLNETPSHNCSIIPTHHHSSLTYALHSLTTPCLHSNADRDTHHLQKIHCNKIEMIIYNDAHHKSGVTHRHHIWVFHDSTISTPPPPVFTPQRETMTPLTTPHIPPKTPTLANNWQWFNAWVQNCKTETQLQSVWEEARALQQRTETAWWITWFWFWENREFVFIIIVQFMMSANSQIRFDLKIVFVYLYITTFHYHHCASLSEDIELIKCLSDIVCRVCE